MDIINFCLFLGLGAIIGALTTATVYRVRVASLHARSQYLDEASADISAKLGDAETELTSARSEVSRLLERVRHFEAKVAEQAELQKTMEVKLAEQFKVLSADALKRNTEQFTSQFSVTAQALLEQLQGKSQSHIDGGHKLLDNLGRSIAEKLTEVDRTVKTLTTLRAEGEAELKTQLSQLLSINQVISGETSKLSNALSNSRVQGVWGEQQLQNVVEAAGMTRYCDYGVQCSATNEEGASVRADMVVQLPNGFHVVVDAKTPTKAFSEAMNAPTATDRKAKLNELTQSLRNHIRTMSKRDYPAFFRPALEYTIVFLPSDSVFLAAIETDPELLRFAEDNKVVLTTPLSLVAFLRAVACGWTKVQIQENAADIQQLGKELFDRLSKFMDGFSEVGQNLEKVVKVYNKAVGTSRNLNATRKKFAQLGTGDPKSVDPGEELPCSVRIIETDAEDLRGAFDRVATAARPEKQATERDDSENAS